MIYYNSAINIFAILSSWTSPDNMPFANSAEYVREDYKISVPKSADQISVVWQNRDSRRYALIFLNDDLLAELVEDAKPGWCRLAKKNGPLAKVLELI